MPLVETGLEDHLDDLEAEERMGREIEALAAEYKRELLEYGNIAHEKNADFDEAMEHHVWNGATQVNTNYKQAQRLFTDGCFRSAVIMREIQMTAVSEYAVMLATRKIKVGC